MENRILLSLPKGTDWACWRQRPRSTALNKNFRTNFIFYSSYSTTRGLFRGFTSNWDIRNNWESALWKETAFLFLRMGKGNSIFCLISISSITKLHLLTMYRLHNGLLQVESFYNKTKSKQTTSRITVKTSKADEFVIVSFQRGLYWRRFCFTDIRKTKPIANVLSSAVKVMALWSYLARTPTTCPPNSSTPEKAQVHWYSLSIHKPFVLQLSRRSILNAKLIK